MEIVGAMKMGKLECPEKITQNPDVALLNCPPGNTENRIRVETDERSNRTYAGAAIYTIRVFCPRASPLLQSQEPRPQLCPKADLHGKLRNPGCSFTRDG